MNNLVTIRLLVNRISQIILGACFLHTCAFGADAPIAPTVDQMLSYMGIDPNQRKALMSGEIIYKEIGDASDKELAVGLVMFVKASPDKLADYVTPEKMFKRDTDTTASGELTGAPADKLNGMKFSADEAQSLLNAEPGSDLNLSTDEIKQFNAARKQVTDDSQIPTVAARTYSNILLGRLRAYLKGGLNAIAPYDRDGNVTSPAKQLTIALNASKIVSQHFPMMFNALLNFPNDQPQGIVNRFFWSEQNIEKHPTLILSHRSSYMLPDAILMADRQFYVGRTYNCMQRLAGCFPVQGGSIVFYANRTNTDQVAGFMSGMKHGIGRGQMRDEITKTFQQVRAAIQ